jgi:hypothetical protein
MQPRLRSILLAAVAVTMVTLACQMSGLGLSSSARETETAWESTKEVMATRAGATARVVTTWVAIYGTSTAQAWQSFLVQKEAWPLLMADAFDDNANEWPTGEDSSQYVEISWNVEGGKYRWDALSVEGYIYWTRPLVPMVGDFWLSVDTLQLTGPESASTGVVFRMQDSDNYYTVLIDSEQIMGMLLKTPEGWETVIDWIEVPAIRPYEVNRIGVSGEGPKFTIFINGVMAAQVFDDRLETGRAGLNTSMYNVGDEGSFEFDNFELRAPQGSVIEVEEVEEEKEE